MTWHLKNSGEYFNVSMHCNSIYEDAFISFILNLKNKDLADTSIKTYVVHIRAFLIYCMKRGYIAEFPVIVPKAEEQIKDVYTDYELSILLKKPDIKTCDFTEYRNWVISNTLFGTAMRVGSLCGLHVGDIDLKSKLLTLRKVKTKKPYVIPITNTLCIILQEYFTFRKGEPEDFLFVDKYLKPLKKSGVQTAIQRYNLRRGVAKVSCHLYRHTFAKKWLLSEGSIYELQRILGHKTLAMVLRYANIWGIDLKKNFEKHNPLEDFSNINNNKGINW
ncbi:MAG: site-specific integrase [Clostridiales bacterium]|nr:site-specific integrase [Clostridiales bacterium]